nr:hypothetical protein Sare_1252 [uncultured bacterium]
MKHWLVDLYRSGYRAYVRFMCAFHGGEPAAKAAEIAALERLYRSSPDSAERKP